MGTTYELLGENKLALQWIKKSVKINPQSHKGSEWMHIKILEAKINGKKSWNSIFILGIDFGTDSLPSSKLSKDQLNDVLDDMYYQLWERMNFIKPKDEMMAMLLFEYGNLAALAEDVTSSYTIYEVAKEYGASSELFEKRYACAKKLQEKITAYELKVAQKRTRQAKIAPAVEKEFPQKYVSILIILLCSVLLLAIGGFLWFKYKKNNS